MSPMDRANERRRQLELESYPRHSPAQTSGRTRSRASDETGGGTPEHFELSRRRFVELFGAGIAVGFLLPDAFSGPQESGGGRRRRRGTPEEISAWLHISEDGSVTVYTGKVEVGQNIRTSLAQAVAEELRVPFESIQMIMGDTDVVPYDRGTFGSQSTPRMGPQLRKVSAAARETLIDLAAEKWQTGREKLKAANGQVTNPETGKSLSYGQLTQGQKLVKTVDENQPLTPTQEWSVLGRSQAKVNGRAFVTGRHHYVSDMSLPGMLHGKVLRPPAYEATMRSLDTSKATAMEGVKVVRDGSFVGLTAPDAPTARAALDAIQAEWEIPEQPSRQEIFQYFKDNPVESRGWRGREPHVAGSVEDGLKAADQTLENTFHINYIAHVPLEPRAALARWENGKLTVWTGTQRPFGVRDELAEAFQMPVEKVRVIMPDTGSGYGGKHTGEAALEAARLAKSAGKPVKLVWTREEEFRWAYFRPGGVIEVRSGVTQEGRLTAWEFHNYNSGGSAIETLYQVPNQHIEFHPARSPLPQGSYRGLAATANHFAREVQMDEMARKLKIDPLKFRLRNLKDARLTAVLKRAAEVFRWTDRKAHKGRGCGIAGGFEKGGYIATCAEVSVTDGQVRVERLAAAFECGAVVNPVHLHNQVEGALIQGLGGALFEYIDFAEGKILNPRLSGYRVPRFSDTPQVEVAAINRKDLSSAGAGETPIVAVAPAVSNAIFDATGVRRRDLPMVPDGLQNSSPH
ncbi:MAG TPA: molybdopterin cofactor-binding domain-containing protein [Acidobacteriota bacterium]|nr:molybdopterin cofactor-binding domain-containing protein [Acidobacteriota bacterium]